MDDSPAEPLLEVGHVVRRVLSARTSDRHLVEDLTQETIVRVAAAKQRLDPDAQRAYAIVTARNLLTSHARRESVRGRHAHRLVDYTQLEGPEHLLLEQEETDALATALEHLDAEDRELLLRHEAEGVDLATIAAENASSRGAVAMRLARARAVLRLEFLLAFRNVDRPSERCRAVLLALSAGDRRRQQALGAPAHLVDCTTCAALAQPVTERNRRIAGWLLLPFAEGVRRLWSVARSHPGATAAAGVAVAAIGAVAVGVLVLPADSDPQEATAVAAPSSSATTGVERTTVLERAAAATAPPTNTALSTSTAQPASTAQPTGAEMCPPPVPLDQLGADGSVGCGFASTALTAVEVPVDEGFWATTSAEQLVWVQLAGTGESPVDVEPGQRVTVTGVVASPPADPLVLGAQPAPTTALPVLFVAIPFDQLTVAG